MLLNLKAMCLDGFGGLKWGIFTEYPR